MPLKYYLSSHTVRFMETLYLGYDTAKWFWERYHDTIMPLNDKPYRACLVNALRNTSEIQDIVAGSFLQDISLDVMVPRCMQGKANGLTFHGCAENYPNRSFIQISPCIYIASPELSFVQVASKHSFIETLLYGYSLCGNFALSDNFQSGLAERNKLVSVRRLKAYVDSCGTHHGILRARKVVRYISEGSASPRESKLSIALTLPLCYGGKGLPAAKMNSRIAIPQRSSWTGGRRYYVADLYWEKARVTVEYDSDVWHANKDGIYRDSDKRNTLIDMGYTPMCFTSTQLDDPDAFDHAAEALRRKLGVRHRPLPCEYQKKVDELRKQLGLSVVTYAPRRVDF